MKWFEQSKWFGWADALRRNDFAAIADWFSLRFFTIGGLGIVAAGLTAWSDSTSAVGLRIFALSLLFGGASTISGWLLGLLFGIPRTLARQGAIAPPGTTPGVALGTQASAPSSRVNTNLEDISDWLTKTIVGVGLTQLYVAPHYLWYAAWNLNAAGFDWTHGQLLALVLFFYFAPGGFWLGYVATRTSLTKLFEWVDRPTPENIAVSGKVENLQVDASGKKIMPASDGLADSDRALLRMSLQTITTPEDMAAWGAAQARDQNIAAAKTALEDAHHTDPANRGFRQQLSKVYTVLGRQADADRLINEPAPLHAAYARDTSAKSVSDLDLADYVKEAAEALRKFFPAVVFTSGRRDVATQASAMAGNVIHNRQWIAQTYAVSLERDTLQKWVDTHPLATDQKAIAAGLASIMGGWTDLERSQLSRHFSGEAFDVQPIDGTSGMELKRAISGLPNLRRFIDNEGGLVIWHAEFRRPSETV